MAFSRFGRWSLLMFFALASPTARLAADDGPTQERGQELFQACIRCHTISKGAEHRFGPNLHGLMERGIAGAPDFHYSPALKAQTGNWTEKSLNAFIAKPHLAVPGNDMPYSGLLSPHDRTDLLAWLIKVSADPGLPESVDAPLTGAENGDKANGKRLFRACRVCHSSKAGAPHKVGPNLFGVMGRPIASAEGFDYAGDLLNAKGVWTPDRLDRFFLARKEFRQGTHRAFKFLRGPMDRADLIAYLATLKAGEQ